MAPPGESKIRMYLVNAVTKMIRFPAFPDNRGGLRTVIKTDSVISSEAKQSSLA